MAIRVGQDLGAVLNVLQVLREHHAGGRLARHLVRDSAGNNATRCEAEDRLGRERIDLDVRFGKVRVNDLKRFPLGGAWPTVDGHVLDSKVPDLVRRGALHARYWQSVHAELKDGRPGDGLASGIGETASERGRLGGKRNVGFGRGHAFEDRADRGGMPFGLSDKAIPAPLETRIQRGGTRSLNSKCPLSSASTVAISSIVPGVPVTA